MTSTSRSLRPHIVLCGPCNGGKSSLINALCNTDVALVSPESGTTTDPVYRNMELLPFGPVTFVDTAGLDDSSALGPARISKTQRTLSGADLVLHVSRPTQSGSLPDIDTLRRTLGIDASIPILRVLTHADLTNDSALADSFLTDVSASKTSIKVSCVDASGIETLREHIASILVQQKVNERSLLQDIVRPAKLVMMIVPVDLEAPAGRLILPQVQAIREVLDSDSATIVVKDREIDWALSLLKNPPDLAITDSQVVQKAAASVPPSIPLTTFSILFSRQKGDLDAFVSAAQTIDLLKDGDKVLIAETCIHRSSCDDIGRVKIPRWLRQYTGRNLDIQIAAGQLPPDIQQYKLIVHCGACMITRRMMLSRLGLAVDAKVPVTNYGVAISHCQGVLERVLKPFERY